MTIYCSLACLHIIRIPLFILFVGKIEGMSACFKRTGRRWLCDRVTADECPVASCLHRTNTACWAPRKMALSCSIYPHTRERSTHSSSTFLQHAGIRRPHLASQQLHRAVRYPPRSSTVVFPTPASASPCLCNRLITLSCSSTCTPVWVIRSRLLRRSVARRSSRRTIRARKLRRVGRRLPHSGKTRATVGVPVVMVLTAMEMTFDDSKPSVQHCCALNKPN